MAINYYQIRSQHNTLPIILPNKAIQFGYHSATGKQIRITNVGLDAERMNVENEFKDDVAYINSVHLLKVRGEFEVKIVSCGVGW